MKYEDTGFRGIYQQFCVFPIIGKNRDIVKEFPGAEEADGVLGYGYIDHQTGLTLEVLACSKRDGQAFHFAETNDSISIKLRIGSVAEDEFAIINDREGRLAERYKEKINTLKTYEVADDIENTRWMDFLDESRNEYFPDDVAVYIVKDGLQPERCWVRIEGIQDNMIIGNLLNEPYQDHGVHEGDTIRVFGQKQEDESIVLISDIDADQKVTS